MSYILLKKVQGNLITQSSVNSIKLFSNFDDGGELYYRNEYNELIKVGGNYNIIELTRNELISLRNSSNLTIGQRYKILDYYNEKLILISISNNSFEPFAYSQDYPQDIVFYDLDSDIITRRIDTILNNDIGCNFRNSLTKRWYINVNNTWTPFNNYSKGDIINNNGEIFIALSDTTSEFIENGNWYKYPYNNGEYIGTTSSGQDILIYGDTYSIPMSNTYSYLDMFSNYNSNIRNNIIGSCSDILIHGDNFHSNNIGDNFHSNNIGDNFHSNNIGDNFHSNNIGDNFSNNLIKYFYNNTITDNFYKNILFDDFYLNTIGSDFYLNISDGLFYLNTIGKYTTQSSFIHSNYISSDFYSNFILNNFRYNDIKSVINNMDLTLSTNIYGDYNCEIFKKKNGDIRLKYIDGDDSDEIVEITD